MANGIVIFLFFAVYSVGLALFIVTHTKKDRISKMATFIGFLEDRNYQFADSKIINEMKNYNHRGFKEFFLSPIPEVKCTKSNIEFTISQDVIRVGNGTKQAIKINCVMPINPNFYLKISRRGILSKLFGKNKGEYHGLNEDYNFECNNLMIAKLLLNNPKNRKILRDLLENGYYGDNTPYEIKNGLSDRKVTYSENVNFLPKIETLILLSNEISKISDNYRIDSSTDIASAEVGDDLKFLTLSEIEFLSPVCVICYQPLIEDLTGIQQEVMGNQNYKKQVDEVLYLVCCSSFVHEDHHLDWVKKRNICPYCKFSTPDTDPIVIQDS